ncbi:MAG: PTS sugar transporter subunit IIA [Sporolactobacillus sp.]
MGADAQELDIRHILNEDLIDLDLQAKTKLEAIQSLIHMLFQNGCITNEDDFLKDVLFREREGVTGLGQGVAIPHGKSVSVVKTSIAVGRTRTPIAWETLDEKPVTLIILFAVKHADSAKLHIKLLQRVAILLADDEMIQHFQSIKTKEELIDLL